jgi:glucose-1-phosphate adenylyltransferase
VVGAGTYVQSYAMVESSVLFGGTMGREHLLETTIGRHCKVRNAILDRHVTLHDGTSIGYDRAEDERRGLKTVGIPGSTDYVVAVRRGTIL